MKRGNGRFVVVVSVSALTLLWLASCSNPAGSDAKDRNDPEVTRVTVAFDSQGGTPVSPQEVPAGTRLTEPNDLSNGDLIFGGWYTEEACNTRWDFYADAANGDCTLFAGWNPADSLVFTLIDAGTAAYGVSKGATAPVGYLYIPAYYKGIPVTEISHGGFEDCSDLENVALTSTLTVINGLAFYSCSSLQELTLPASVSSVTKNALFYCDALTAVEVRPGNAQYSSRDGVLFDDPGSTLLWYPASKSDTAYAVPSGVTELSGFAFMNTSFLEDVTLPAGLSTIRYCAFHTSPSVTDIFIPLAVSTVEQYGFIGCHSLSIRCEASSRPAGWDEAWYNNVDSVEWGASE